MLCAYRFTGGRHGFGAKLTNIFSTKFEVDINDAKNKKHYSQAFKDNMAIIEPPVISEAKGNTSWTKITFSPGNDNATPRDCPLRPSSCLLVCAALFCLPVVRRFEAV